MFYRCIKKPFLPGGGSAEWIVYDVLYAAYRKCIPEDESESHRRLYHAVSDDINNGKTLILVTHDSKADMTYWIECIEDENADVPYDKLVSELPGCCAK